MGARRLAFVFAGLIALVSCGSNEPKTTPAGVSIEILEPAGGTAVKGNTLTLKLKATGIDIVKADGDRSGKTGHYHVFIGEAPVQPGETIPKTSKIIHSADDIVQLTGLSLGAFDITVVIGDGAHTRLGNVQASLKNVKVEGPTVNGVLPASVSAGKPFVLDVNVAGVSLVPADGDASGKTGHLHLFIDKDPTPDGQGIPKGDPSIIHVKPTSSGAAQKVAVPALAKGDHVVWIVLGDGLHVPFSPRVAHKLTITVV